VLAEEAIRRSRELTNTLLWAVGAYALTFAVLTESVPEASFFLGPSFGIGWDQKVLRTLYVAAFIAVLALPGMIVAASVVGSRLLLVRVIVPGVLLGMVLAIWIDPVMTFHEDWPYIPVGVALSLVLTAGLAGRQTRNVIPLLTLFLFGLSTFLLVLVPFLAIARTCFHPVAVTALLQLVGLMLLFWAGYRLTVAFFTVLKRYYDRGRFSDGQLQSASWIGLLTFVLALTLGPESEGGTSASWWSVLGFAPLCAYGLVVHTARRRKPVCTPPVRLLLLRVFSHDDRGERLLDELAYQWRFLGPIRMISGPDLMCATLDVHELVAYLARRLDRLFITNAAALEKRLAALTDHPDPDRRYRIDELFCSDASWQPAVEELVIASHAILLDLRGFTLERSGTAFEIGLLTRLGLMPRTVFLVDSTTDRIAVEKASGAQQNRLPGEAQPFRVLDVTQLGRGAHVLLHALTEASTTLQSTCTEPIRVVPRVA
jgi:hypothetical protein